MSTTDALFKEWCSQVMIVPVRYCVDPGCGDLSVPILRSVLGKALWDGQPATYREVFRRDQPGTPTAQSYVLSTSMDTRSGLHAITLTLVGSAIRAVEAVDSAFRQAASNGVGRDRVRLNIATCCGIRPDRSLTAEPVAWALSEARWCNGDDPASAPCRLDFNVPLRLQARRITSGGWSDGRPLITAPSFSNLVAAGFNRLGSYLAEQANRELESVRAGLIEGAEDVPCSEWRGRGTAVERWSASQRREVKLRGITGSIELPSGAGAFWPLMAAVRWLHLGKNTTHGLGAFDVSAMSGEESSNVEVQRSAPEMR